MRKGRNMMSQKTIYYQRNGLNYTFSKGVYSFEEFEEIVPLFEDHLHRFGHQTFNEYLKSRPSPGAAAAASCIGGRYLRKYSLEEAVEANGENVQIVFTIDSEAKVLTMESELSDEAICLELKVLDLHHYRAEVNS